MYYKRINKRNNLFKVSNFIEIVCNNNHNSTIIGNTNMLFPMRKVRVSLFFFLFLSCPFLLQFNYFSPEWFGLPAIHDSFLVYLLNLRPVFSSFHFHVGRGKSPSISWWSLHSFSLSCFPACVLR